MLSPLIVEGEIQVLENQRRRPAACVIPDHRRTVDADALLRQYPIRHPAVTTLRRDRNSCDVELAVGVAPQVQRRRVDAQQAQTNLQPWQRRPREDALDAGKGQRRLPLSIGNAHIGKDQIGVDPLPTGFDLPDDDGQAQRLADVALDFGSVALDVRQDQVAQGQDQQHEAEIEHHQAPYRRPPEQANAGVRDHRHQVMPAMVERRAQVLRAHQIGPGYRDFCQQSVSVTRMSEYLDRRSSR